MNKQYPRVIPRDLFNEAKLLKCVGRLVLLIHDGELKQMSFEHDGEPFEIVQDDSDGSLSIVNIKFFLENEPIDVYTRYNSKDSYPILYRHKDVERYIFDDNGKCFFADYGFPI